MDSKYLILSGYFIYYIRHTTCRLCIIRNFIVMGKINPTAKLLKLIFDSTNYKHLIDSSMFITGSTGFLGSALLKSIDYINREKKTNIKIFLLLRKNSNYASIQDLNNTEVEVINGDLTNFKFVSLPIDHIIHLASEKAENLIKYNKQKKNTIIYGTKRLIEYNKIINAKSFTFLSSGAIYGKNCKSKKGWKEENDYKNDLKNSNLNYAKFKREAEKILQDYYYLSGNLKTLNIFRAFSFGGYDNKENKFAYHNFIKKRIKRKNIYLQSNGNSIRNYMHPLDLANWIFKSLNLKGKNIINSGSNHNVSIKELANIIAAHKFDDLPRVKIYLGNKKEQDIYIPNLNKANRISLECKVSLQKQIEESFYIYYNTEYHEKKNCSF